MNAGYWLCVVATTSCQPVSAYIVGRAQSTVTPRTLHQLAGVRVYVCMQPAAIKSMSRYEYFGNSLELVLSFFDALTYRMFDSDVLLCDFLICTRLRAL
jgi:hypothetical protein